VRGRHEVRASRRKIRLFYRKGRALPGRPAALPWKLSKGQEERVHTHVARQWWVVVVAVRRQACIGEACGGDKA
jgi:hypothetical protein